MPEEIFYRDLPLDPTVTSDGDISSVVNKDSIKQSLNMILKTGRGSRIFLPDYGARIKAFLFEPFDNTTAQRLGNEVEETIKNYEQRIELLSINVSMIQSDASYEVAIVYRIVNTQVVDSFKLSLEKL